MVKIIYKMFDPAFFIPGSRQYKRKAFSFNEESNVN